MQRADFDSKFLRFLQMDLYHFHNNKHKKVSFRDSSVVFLLSYFLPHTIDNFFFLNDLIIHVFQSSII